jgi:RNA polymerase-binding transcription factor DksA
MSEEDKAQEVELKQWEHNNRSRQEPKKYAPTDEGYGPEECDDCGSSMPTARREHGFKICVSCKTIEEKQAAKFRR